jgi:hypothetical protein
VLGGKVVLLVIGDGEVRLLVGLIMLIEDELVLGRGDFGVLWYRVLFVVFDNTSIHDMILPSLIVDEHIPGRIQNAWTMFRIIAEPNRSMRSIAGWAAIGATTEM